MASFVERDGVSEYDELLAQLSGLLEAARRAVNAVLTQTYWEIGQRMAFTNGVMARASS